jgi:hypothetical protein
MNTGPPLIWVPSSLRRGAVASAAAQGVDGRTATTGGGVAGTGSVENAQNRRSTN